MLQTCSARAAWDILQQCLYGMVHHSLPDVFREHEERVLQMGIVGLLCEVSLLVLFLFVFCKFETFLSDSLILTILGRAAPPISCCHSQYRVAESCGERMP